MKELKCQYCDGRDFIETRQSGYAEITGEGLHSTSLYHTICRNCGSVVRSYVKEPEKLLRKKNRHSDE